MRYTPKCRGYNQPGFVIACVNHAWQGRCRLRQQKGRGPDVVWICRNMINHILGKEGGKTHLMTFVFYPSVLQRLSPAALDPHSFLCMPTADP